jgi:CRISPR system Cascade subunit CasC
MKQPKCFEIAPDEPTMFVEIHILQNFSPANLNRGDTGAPKDCTFGGYRRARISSQCLKRAIRHHDEFKKTVKAAGGDTGVRTKRLIKELTDILTKKADKYQEQASTAAENVLNCLVFGFTEEQKSEYLLYFGNSEIDRFVEVAVDNWEIISKPIVERNNSKGKPKTVKQIKDEQKKLCNPKETTELKKVHQKLEDVVSKEKLYGSDIALFGRMMADHKNMNVDAACQVAHAISTNEVAMEMDFYTAIDDLLPDEETGSDMMGIVEFNSSCFYRYAQINLGILNRNLAKEEEDRKEEDKKAEDKEMAIAAVLGFLKASVYAVPSGMQNSLTAQNPPSYVRVLIRSQGSPWALTNAFIAPVRVKRNDTESLIDKSIQRLEEYMLKLQEFYEESFDVDLVTSVDLPKKRQDKDLPPNQSFPELVAAVEKHLQTNWLTMKETE